MHWLSAHALTPTLSRQREREHRVEGAHAVVILASTSAWAGAHPTGTESVGGKRGDGAAIPSGAQSTPAVARQSEIVMNEETFNLSIRKFLKMVGVSSQREIEHAVAKAIEAGTLKGSGSLPATMTLDVPSLRLSVKFDGDITLD
jgi:hypothetical protein